MFRIFAVGAFALISLNAFAFEPSNTQTLLGLSGNGYLSLTLNFDEDLVVPRPPEMSPGIYAQYGVFFQEGKVYDDYRRLDPKKPYCKIWHERPEPGRGETVALKGSRTLRLRGSGTRLTSESDHAYEGHFMSAIAHAAEQGGVYELNCDGAGFSFGDLRRAFGKVKINVEQVTIEQDEEWMFKYIEDHIEKDLSEARRLEGIPETVDSKPDAGQAH